VTVLDVRHFVSPVVSGEGGVTTLINPATEDAWATVDLASVEDTDRAISAATARFEEWRLVSPGDRARLLRRFATLVDEHREDLAQLEVANSGHTIGNARWEAGNVRDVLDYYSGAPERLMGHQIPVPGGVDITFHEPIGVVGIIVPWNFPMPIAGWGFAPALAAGNTVVLKPAELTPLTALRLGELALEAGLPADVFTVLPGHGSVVGERFVTNPAVRKICFTGSTAVGKRILRGAADQVKRVTLELGGKSANIVFADADLEAAAAGAPMAAFDNTGQDCCARSRLLVQRSVFDRFVGLLEPHVTGLRVGDPGDAGVDLGPLISADQRAAVENLAGSAEVVCSAPIPGGPGFWSAPRVVLPRGPGDPVWTDEIFGPVISLMPFDDEVDAICLANDTPYGLSGSIFTRDVGRALRVARAVESGTLSINSHSSVRYWTPFGGFKQSGLGRELGPDAPAAFTETKNVFISSV
jgi:acyl-CoA reductase-like NAD-dependent aldehyde dehydrogenase